MNTIQYDLGGGASIALPADIVARSLIDHLKRGAQVAAPVPRRPAIGEYLAGEGGIYVGDIRGDDGAVYGLVVPEPEDVGRAAWGAEPPSNLSAWDGLINTNTLRSGNHPAAKMAAAYEAEGHVDFYLPSRRELLVAAANVPHLFGSDSWYWTSSARGEYPWAVDFEDGIVDFSNRFTEFRVRPFRRLPL